MPGIWIWGLLASLVMLAIGTTLKTAEISHSLKLSNEEVTRLRQQIEILQKEAKKFPLNTSNLNTKPKNNITVIHSDTPKKEILTFTSAESLKIAPGIKVKTEFKQTGWYCVSKDIICMEHNRTLKPNSISRPYEFTCRAVGCKVKIKTPLMNLAKSEAKDLTESHIRTHLNIEPMETDRLGS